MADQQPPPPADAPLHAQVLDAHGAAPGGPPRRRRGVILAVLVVLAVIGAVMALPAIRTALSTVSTDDAYVNGHATFVAPRVAGQVSRVLVDDNNRVRKGDLIVQLDKEPYQVQLAIRQSGVDTAQAELASAIASVRSNEALARSLRWKLQHAMEDVENQIALLRTNVANLESAQAVAKRAKADLDRAIPLAKSGAVASEELDRRTQVYAVAEAQVKQALQEVNQVRVSLGLPAMPIDSGDLAAVPPDLDETFSSVRQAQAELMQAAFSIGVVYPLDNSPKQMLADFLKRDPSGDIDKIYAKILETSPSVRVAREKLAQAQRDLDQAKLNLRYTDVFAEIDGVVTRRNVNPGDNVAAGQALMAIRSLTEIWVDANFKETELGELRIGQRADLYIDMYGKRKVFKGRVSGFTMGTGSTLALLPAQNATGNFVKVVQRLPVRIDFEDYHPDQDPVFVGLSVTPYVYVQEPPSGPNAGKILQPMAPPDAAPATLAASAPATAPATMEATP